MKLHSMLLLGMVLASVAAAAEPQKTEITADTLEYRYGEHKAAFHGNVVVKDPEVTMTANALVVNLTEANAVREVIAEGKVVVVQADRRATCRKAYYSAETGVIIMTGDAQLVRGRDVVKGDKITIDTQSQRVTCRPGSLMVFSADGGGISDAVKVP